MNLDEYRAIQRMEHAHWWYRALDDLVLGALRRILPQGGRVLDAGCGTGRIARHLAGWGGGWSVAGLDYEEEALNICRERGQGLVARGSVMDLPFKDREFDAVVSLDVIYHQAVTDDIQALGQFARVLKPGGRAVIQVAALEALRGRHDIQVHTRERYTKGLLRERLARAGLEPEILSYRLFPLFPLVLLSRLMESDKDSARTDIQPAPGWLDALLFNILRLENRLLPHLPMPIGSSLFCVARPIQANRGDH